MPARGGDGRRKRLLAPARTVWRYHGRACLLQHARARRLARRERGLTENDIACGGVIWELSLMSACSQWRWAVWWVGAVYCVAGSPPYSRTASTLHCGALDGTWVASTTQECRGLQVSLLANASAAAGCGWHARLARVTSFADGGGGATANTPRCERGYHAAWLQAPAPPHDCQSCWGQWARGKTGCRWLEGGRSRCTTSTMRVPSGHSWAGACRPCVRAAVPAPCLCVAVTCALLRRPPPARLSAASQRCKRRET